MEDNEKINIELYQSLKNKAYLLFKPIKDKKNINLSEIESILDIYDIDPIINEFYLQKCLDYFLNMNEISIKIFSEKYLHYINSLSLTQKINLNKKIETNKEIYNYMKSYINNDSNIKKIYQIFNYIYEYKNEKHYDINELKSLFNTKYLIDIEKFHIPLIYGTNELRYAAIINDIKSFLFDNQILSINSFPENKFNKNIENNIHNIHKKLCFLYSFIRIIIDRENEAIFDYQFNFQKDDSNLFLDDYILNDNIDFIYYNFLYLDFLMYCYFYFPNEILGNIKQYLKMFESNKEKKNILNKELNNNIILEVITDNKEENNYEKIKIKYFNNYNKEEYFEFNPYEYIIENIDFYLTYEDFKNQFENKKNFSLYKFYKTNQMFEDVNLNQEYKNNIYQMLFSNITNIIFDKFPTYQKFNNPFKENNKEIIEQINRVKLYIYFPLYKFGGITFNKIGIIFINKAFKKIGTSYISIKLIKSIINISYKKITEYYEILIHYTKVLFKANSKNIELKIQNNVFDELEDVMFGNKFEYLTIKAAIFIISEKNWNLNNIEDFREQFMNKNEIKDDDINIDLFQKNNLIKTIININKINFEDKETMSVNAFFSFIIFRNIDDNSLYDSGDEEEEDFRNFSITSNAFLPRKISISKIIKDYGSGP